MNNYRFISSFKSTQSINISEKDKLLKFLKNAEDTSTCEYLNNGMITKPYFDCEKEFYKNEKPTDEYMIDCLNKYIELIVNFFDIDKSDIAVSQRHGFFKKDINDEKKFKMSWRLFITNMKINFIELKIIVNFFKTIIDHFDNGCYNDNRKMAILNGIKDNEVQSKKRKLIKFTNHDDLDFLIQYTSDDSKLISINDFLDKLPKNERKVENNILVEHKVKNSTISQFDFEKVIMALHHKRAIDHKLWIQCLLAICNVARFNKWPKEYCDKLIHIFSKRGDNYNKEYAQQMADKYYNNSDDTIQLASIKYWLKQDDYNLYKQIFYIVYTKLCEKLYHPLNNGPTHNNIAEILLILKPNFIYTGCNRIYERNDFNIYKLLDEETQDYLFCRNIIIDVKNDFIKYSDNKINELKQKICNIEVNNEVIKKEIENMRILVGKYKKNRLHTIKSLETYNFVKNTFQVYKTHITDSIAEYKFNTDKNIIGFNNGIYDFNLMKFRLPGANEYVSYTTGYDYDPHLDFTEVEKFMFDTSYDDECAIYRISRLAKLLIGGNIDQMAIFKLGIGSNGKSVEDNIIRTCFGDYCSTIPLSFWIDKKVSSEGPSPFLLSLKNVKVAITNETEEEQRIVSNKFKSITGNDLIAARQMYVKKIQKFMPFLTPILFLNVFPKFTELGDAELRRIEVDSYCYKFYDIDNVEYNPNNKFHKLRDTTLNDRFKMMGGNIFNMLLHYYKNYVHNKNLRMPQYLRQETLKIKYELDSIRAWKVECLIATDDKLSMLYDDAFQNYKEFCGESITPSKFTRNLRRVDILCKNTTNNIKRIFGYKLVLTDSIKDDID